MHRTFLEIHMVLCWLAGRGIHVVMVLNLATCMIRVCVWGRKDGSSFYRCPQIPNGPVLRAGNVIASSMWAGVAGQQSHLDHSSP